MLNCIIIKNDDISNIKVRNLTEDSLYKKCGFKTNKDFEKILSLDYNGKFLEAWGKTDKTDKNKLSNIFLNKYNLKSIGKIIIIVKNDKEYISIEKDEFIKYFNLNNKVKDNSDDEEDIEEENYTTNLLSKNIEKNNLDDIDVEEDNISINSELTYDAYCYSDED